jgi:hypothetical protein
MFHNICRSSWVAAHGSGGDAVYQGDYVSRYSYMRATFILEPANILKITV